MNRFEIRRLAASRVASGRIASMLRTTLIGATWLIVFGNVGLAVAQHDAQPPSTPAPPAGDGRLTIEVRHATNPAAAAGLEIALYALAPDGRPGFARGETDAAGRFVFEGLSPDPGIVYLAGVRHNEIPFGERAQFVPGAKEAVVALDISDPTDRVTGVDIEEIRLRVDWAGDRLRVREILRLRNQGNRVVRIPNEPGRKPILSRTLGTNVADFAKGSSSIGEDLSFTDGEARFWGPLYLGEQRVEFEYTLPVETSSADSPDGARLAVSVAEGAARVVVIAGTRGILATGERLIASSDVQSDAGTPLSAWARSDLKGGERFEIALALPQTRNDRDLLSIPRHDVWLEVDDTLLSATVDITVSVPPGAPLTGSPEAPLLRIDLPEGATLGGVDPQSQSLGLAPRADGGFDMLGPLPAGDTKLGYAFRMPASPEGVDLGLRFPAEVATLNVLIADTGVALASTRLHRLRPFRSGTRNFLHREAFNVTPSEVVDLRLAPLSATGLPRSATTALTLAAAVAGALFLITPLRGGAGRSAPIAEASAVEVEQEAIYATIRDLDHDFETGKLEEADYERMRTEMRNKAIALLRSARGPAAAAPRPQAKDPATGETEISGASQSTGRAPAQETASAGSFCTECGGALQPQWRFCSHCGAEIIGGDGTTASEEDAG